MNVAWLSPYLPAPATSGGVIRQKQLSAALARHANVHLFARGEVWEAGRLHGGLAPFATTWLGRDYLPQSKGVSASRRVRSGSPASMYRAVAELHRKVGVDLVVVAHSWAALGASALGLPWLLDEHNIESHYFRDWYRSREQAGPRVNRELAEIERWERKAWATATAVSCVSRADCAVIAAVRNAGRVGQHGDSSAPLLAEPVVVENGAELEPGLGSEVVARRGGVLFVGSMHHKPNEEAALRLLQRIMPRVWEQLPGVRLTVVGGPVTSALSAAGGALKPNERARIELPGFVPEVRPYLRDARVYANPMGLGAGSSLKIAEALASSIPLVSSELGVRGFDLRPGEHYLAANTDEEHARAIVRLWRDSALATALSTAAHAEAKRYEWRALGDRFAALALSAAAADR